MSAVNDIFTQSESVLLGSGHADTAVMLSGVCAGKSFQARLDVMQDIAFEALMGKDNREKTMLRVLPNEFPDNGSIKRNDFLFSEGVKWKIVDRNLNPATVTVDFTLEKQIDVILLVVNLNHPGTFFLTDSHGVFLTTSDGKNIII